MLSRFGAFGDVDPAAAAGLTDPTEVAMYDGMYASLASQCSGAGPVSGATIQNVSCLQSAAYQAMAAVTAYRAQQAAAAGATPEQVQEIVTQGQTQGGADAMKSVTPSNQTIPTQSNYTPPDGLQGKAPATTTPGQQPPPAIDPNQVYTPPMLPPGYNPGLGGGTSSAGWLPLALGGAIGYAMKQGVGAIVGAIVGYFFGGSSYQAGGSLLALQPGGKSATASTWAQAWAQAQAADLAAQAAALVAQRAEQAASVAAQQAQLAAQQAYARAQTNAQAAVQQAELNAQKLAQAAAVAWAKAQQAEAVAEQNWSQAEQVSSITGLAPPTDYIAPGAAPIGVVGTVAPGTTGVAVHLNTLNRG